MRIGIDARFLAQPGSGVHRYLVNLLHWLPEVAPQHEYYLYGGGPAAAPPAVSLPGPFQVRWITGPPALYSFSPALLLAMRRDHLDLFHGTAYTLPLLAGRPTVLTLHDLTFEVQPAWYSSWSGRLFRAYIRYSASRADRVIADSEATCSDIRRYYGLPPKRVSTVYLGGAAPEFRLRDRGLAWEQVRRQAGLQTPFLLYVGALHERKNVPRLVEAFRLARQMCALPHSLLIIGAGSAAELAALDGLIARLGLSEQVKRLPPVSDDQLPLFYSAAEAFIYPSLYEGFGLPTLEAMASGTPVITSRSSSLAEIVGPAGALVDPGQTADMARVIASVLTDAALRAELSARGLQRTREFSWQTCARQTTQIYQAARDEARL